MHPAHLVASDLQFQQSSAHPHLHGAVTRVRKVALYFGASPASRQVVKDCEDFGPHRDPILLLGERGTGKTALAAYLHSMSRRDGGFVATAAPRIPDSLAQSILFGYVRGAYTGAERDRAGEAEQAHRGTFFFDELGDATPLVQQLLMDLLDGRPVRRLGEDRDRLLDVRFVLATNEDLAEAVRQRRFRAELLDRIGYAMITVPPLRARIDEILPLAEQFLAERAGPREGYQLNASAEELLLGYPWPGNVRELRKVLDYATMRAGTRLLIGPMDLPREFRERVGAVSDAAWERSKRQQAEDAMRRSRTKKEAAQHLGWSRPTLNKWLRGSEGQEKATSA